jgi:GNAT superfamily N-acetyltransferase
MTTVNHNINIRPAIPADAETIFRLIKGLADFENLTPPDEAAGQRLINDAFGERSRFDIFLAEVAGQTAGYIFIFETYSTFSAYPKLYLEDLFVLPEYRDQQVGYALFRYCVAEAERRGCIRMEWAVLDWNEHAQNFYRRLGGQHTQEWLPYHLTSDQFQTVINIT